MAPVGEGNSSQVDGTESAGQRHAPEADVERPLGDLKRLEREDKCFKHFLDSDLKTAKKKIENYEIDYPADSMQFSCVGQLQDAQDIVAVYKRLTERWKNVESHQKDIKMCILSGVKLQEKEVDEKIEKLKHH